MQRKIKQEYEMMVSGADGTGGTSDERPQVTDLQEQVGLQVNGNLSNRILRSATVDRHYMLCQMMDVEDESQERNRSKRRRQVIRVLRGLRNHSNTRNPKIINYCGTAVGF